VANGGRFQHGFLSAGVSTAVAPYSARMPGGYVGQIGAAAVVGGTVSELSGGKFANGATTAAFLATMDAADDYYRRTVGYDADIVPGRRGYTDADGNCCSYEPIDGRPPGPEYDVSGLNRDLDGSWFHPRNWLKQGGLIGRFVNYVLPFGKATSPLHDTWLNVNPGLSNVGTMLPAYAVSTAAVPGVFFRGWESNPMAWHYISQPPRRREDD
jgi:hypothetical protein